MNKPQLALLLALAIAVHAATHAAQAPVSPGTSSPTPGSATSQVSVETAMANNDLNKDGVITKAEATKAARRLIQSWDQYDLNKDGKVDKSELAKGLAALQDGAGTTPPATDNKDGATQGSSGKKK
jgi:Ca2+-binding EF-hand superfamily protein